MLTDSLGNVGGPKVVLSTTQMWEKWNSVLPLGIFGVEILANGMVRVKIGNNLNAWKELPYFANEYTLSKVSDWTPNVPYEKSNLVVYKGSLYMAKENVEASTMFDESLWRQISSQAVQDEIDSKLPKVDANRNLLDNVDASASPDGVKLNLSYYNLYSKTTGSLVCTLPIANDTNSGIMSASVFRTIQDNTARISALEGRSSYFLVDMSVISGTEPTQDELNTMFENASGMEAPFDGATLVSNADTTLRYRWYESSKIWHRENSGGVGIATNNTLGVVAGSTSDGKIEVELDGTMKLNGYEKIVEGKTYNAKGLTADLNEEGLRPLVINPIVIEDENEEGKEPDSYLNLVVTENDLKKTGIKGIAINGHRLDFNANSLSIHTANERENYHLEQGPYTITSPYSAVDAYGHIFLFDEKIPGKGIIRTKENKVLEVSNLDLYAPDSSVNLIHILGPNDEEVCYIVNEKNQTATLIIYPDGTYKTANSPSVDITPQNAFNVEMLTSVDGTRHSLLMYNALPLGSDVPQTPDKYVLLQLEDCTFSTINSETPALDGSLGSFQFGNDHHRYRIVWEGHTDYEDFKSEANPVIDTTYADNTNGNRRLPYNTGSWDTFCGSVLKYRKLASDRHNGVYKMGIGAAIYHAGNDTNTQVMIATPEGYLGWCSMSSSLTSSSRRMWREIPIRSGEYKGKTALLMCSEDLSTQCLFFVNTPDGDPSKTVCVTLKTDQTNLNHVNGKNPIEAGFGYRPDYFFADGKRIYFDASQETAAGLAAQRRYFVYLNNSEIQPSEMIDDEVVKKFDFHCLDTKLDSTDGETALDFNSDWFSYMENIDFGTAIFPYKGTLVKGIGNCDAFFPEAEDEWEEGDGTEDNPAHWVTRPYIIPRPNNVGNFDPKGAQPTNWFKYMNTCATWNKHHFQALGVAAYQNGTAGNTVTQVLDYYYSAEANKVVCGAVNFAAGLVGLPIVVSDDLILFWNYDGSARCIAVIWDAERNLNAFTSPNDYVVVDGGQWTPPRGTTGMILYKDILSSFEENEEFGCDLYIFDPVTSRNSYLKLSIRKLIEEEGEIPDEDTGDGSEPEVVVTPIQDRFVATFTEITMPRTIAVGNLIAYDNHKVILTTNGDDTVLAYLTINSGQALAVMYTDECNLKDVYDISNPFNPEESAYRAYAIFPGDNKEFFYVLERDIDTGIPQISRYAIAGKIQGRLWALPSGEKNGVKTMRFAMGASEGKDSTSATPFTVIERIGGTIQGDSNPIDFTKVREVECNGASAPLAMNLFSLVEPELVPGEDKTVRFCPSSIAMIAWTSTKFTSCQDKCLLGYDENNSPIYGPAKRINRNAVGVNRLITATTTSVTGGAASQLSHGIVEIGMDKQHDNWIRLRYGSGDCIPAIKIAENWEAFSEDTPISVATEGDDTSVGITVKGGKNTAVWLIGIDIALAAATYNNSNWEYNKLAMVFPVKTSTDTSGELVEGKKTEVMFTSSGNTILGTTLNAPGSVINSSFYPTFRKGKIAENILTTYINNPPIISDIAKSIPINKSTSDFVNKTVELKTYSPAVIAEVNKPPYDLHTNQIIPGIFRRKDNQYPTDFASDNPAIDIMPYFEFTDDNVSMIFKNADNSPIEGIIPFNDSVRTCHPRTGEQESMVFMNRDKYDSEDGKAIVSCFYLDENQVSKFRQITIPEAWEIVEALSYVNARMEFFAMTKSWTLDFTDLIPRRADTVPVNTASVYFDLGLDLAMILSDDQYNIHKYIPQSLALFYRGEIVETVSLRDLVLRGQTMAEYMSVVNTLSVNLIEANKIITQMMQVNKALIENLEVNKVNANSIQAKEIHADELFLKSKYPDVTY